jgi:AcrR family transcriptional regulator
MPSQAHTSERPDARRERGDRTRRSILESAAWLASTEGLEGLSIGGIAEHVGMSKSGLYAHFGSKEELQLATIEAAGQIYERAIVDPVMALPPGRDRILALCDGFLDFIASDVLPGGCFFISSFLDPATKRASIKAVLADAQREWLDLMTELVTEAQDLGEVGRDLPAAELAYELEMILAGADVHHVVFADRWYLDQARAAVRRRLG